MRTAVVSGVVAAVLILLLLMGSDNSLKVNVVFGVLKGAIFGLVAIGLVLVYKGTRVFNFMQGEFGTLGGYLMFVAFDRVGMPYGVSFVVALIGVLLIALIVERIFIRPLINAPRITVLVATIAAALLAVGIEILVFRIDPLGFPSFFPEDMKGPQMFGQFINPQSILSLGVLLTLGAVLAYFFSRTDTGLAVLATSQDAFATRAVGIGVERMSRFIWGSAALTGALAGILFVPIAGALVPGVMTSNLLIPSFAAAVIGGMTSLPGAFIGGVVVGTVQQLGLWASGRYFIGDLAVGDVIPGLEQVAILVVLLAVLLIRPAGLLGRET